MESEKQLLNRVNSGNLMALDASNEKLSEFTNIKSLQKSQLLNAGDYCSILRPSNEISKSSCTVGIDRNYCIFVARHLMHSTYIRPRQEILWVRLTVDNEIILIHSESVNGIPSMYKQSELSKQLDSVEIDRTGTLPNGMKYIRYPIGLYHDDFQPRSTIIPHGSVGGCYFIPLSFWCRTKSCPSSARIVSLTPPGHSTCEIICIIVDDIIDGIVNGITAINPTGEEVIVYLDLVCLIADYPAVSPAIDTRGHAANAPCTVCTFPRQRDCFDSDYGYMSNANWQNPSFARSMERTSILRNAEISDQDMLSLGMKSYGTADWKDSPLILFHRKLLEQESKATRVVDNNNIQISHAVFDPYMSSIEAPDHCLMGLIKNCTDLYFYSLENDRIRKEVDLLIETSLIENGLPRQSSVYGIKKNLFIP
ncbi:MAG: hypothetical protein AAF391_04070 [Bacteroidota bacterium]